MFLIMPLTGSLGQRLSTAAVKFYTCMLINQWNMILQNCKFYLVEIYHFINECNIKLSIWAACDRLKRWPFLHVRNNYITQLPPWLKTISTTSDCITLNNYIVLNYSYIHILTYVSVNQENKFLHIRFWLTATVPGCSPGFQTCMASCIDIDYNLKICQYLVLLPNLRNVFKHSI